MACKVIKRKKDSANKRSKGSALLLNVTPHQENQQALNL